MYIYMYIYISIGISVHNFFPFLYYSFPPFFHPLHVTLCSLLDSISECDTLTMKRICY